MIQQNEIITLICSIGVLIFIHGYRSYLWRVPRSRLLIASYSLLVAGWTATVLEGYIWPATLNLFEHLCHAVAAIILVFWLLHLPARGEPI